MPLTNKDLEAAAEAASLHGRQLDSVAKVAADMGRQYSAALEGLTIAEPPEWASQAKLAAEALGAASSLQHSALQDWATKQSQLLDGLGVDVARATGAMKMAGMVSDTAIKNAIDNLQPAFAQLVEGQRQLIQDAFTPPHIDLSGALDSLQMSGIGDILAQAVARIDADALKWSDVLDARAGFVGTLDELEVDDDEVVDVTEAATLPEQEPWTRGEKIAFAGLVVGTMSMLLMFLAAQDSIVRNARYDAHLFERAVDQLVDYVAKLVVWYAELPKA